MPRSVSVPAPAPAATPLPPANRLLAALSPDDRAVLMTHAAPVTFAVGDDVIRAGARIDGLLFLESGIAGVLDTLDADRRYAVGLVGVEGFVGWPLLMGDEFSPFDVTIRARPAHAWSIPVRTAGILLENNAPVRNALLRFAHVFMLQMARTIVSSLAHSIERRMARWILLYHDRVGGDDIYLTHEEFRLMLGVRRSSVTDALHRLEAARAIRALRGRIQVLDRNYLTMLAENTYGEPERAYARLLPPHDTITSPARTTAPAPSLTAA